MEWLEFTRTDGLRGDGQKKVRLHPVFLSGRTCSHRPIIRDIRQASGTLRRTARGSGVYRPGRRHGDAVECTG